MQWVDNLRSARTLAEEIRLFWQASRILGGAKICLPHIPADESKLGIRHPGARDHSIVANLELYDTRLCGIRLNILIFTFPRSRYSLFYACGLDSLYPMALLRQNVSAGSGINVFVPWARPRVRCLAFVREN